MIIGFVNVEFEPIIPLSIRRADGKVFTQDAIVDTFFTICRHQNFWLRRNLGIR